jgi:hypothetical protein
MAQDNGKFRISLAMAEYLKLSPLPAPAKKLLLALIYLQEIEEEAWPKVLLDETGKPDVFKGEQFDLHYIPVSHLHFLGFAPRSKSSRFLTKPIADLQKLSGFFDDLSLKPGKNGHLSWKFGIFPAALMTDMDTYGLMESEDIAHCSGDFDVALLTQITLRHKMRFPISYFFTLDPKAGGLIEAVDFPVLDRRPLVAKLSRALQKWAALKNCRLVAELGQNGSVPGITSVTIRISHSDTEWNKQQLSKFHPRSIVIDVSP